MDVLCKRNGLEMVERICCRSWKIWESWVAVHSWLLQTPSIATSRAPGPLLEISPSTAQLLRIYGTNFYQTGRITQRQFEFP